MGKTKGVYRCSMAGFIVFLVVWMLFQACNIKAIASNVDEFEVSIQTVEKYDMAYEVLSYINQERQDLGMQPLVMDRQLMEAALIRAAEVNVLNSHWRPNGTRSTSGMGIGAVYENINSYAISGQSVYEGWITSKDGHRVPITDPACRSVGIGIVNHVAVAEFAYSDPDEIKVSGTHMKTRSILFRLGFCQFSLQKGTSLEYGGESGLMLTSTIENQGIPVAINMSEFSISSNNTQVVMVSNDGMLRGKGTGTAEIKVVWKGNPDVTSSTTFSVKPLDISVQGNAGFIYEQKHIYSGSAIEPQVTVTDKYGCILQKGKDYSLTYVDNVNSGKALITVQGQGNYSGKRYLSFTIEKPEVPEEIEPMEPETQNKEVKMAFLANFNYVIPTVILSQKSYIYDGSAKTPAVNVSVKGEQLKAGVDYYVSYENNINPGQATVVVKGINRCSGEYRVAFHIEKQVQQENISGNSKSSVTVIYSKSELTSQKDPVVKTVTNKSSKKVTVKQLKIQKIKNRKKKQLTVYWKKDKSVSGYQIQIATNKKMTKERKTIKVSKKKNSYVIKKLKSRKTYYVRIRSYKKVRGKIYCSKWSKIKKARVN